jgi:hypothetical protein
MVIIKFEDIELAFDHVSFAQMSENQAYLNKETGEIVYQSEVYDNFEELPDDIEDDKYIEIPHKNELELGRHLVFDFVYQQLPDEAEKIESFFRKKRAYSKFKAFLESKGIIDTWYEFESKAQDKALREWCKENEIKIDS